MSDAQRKARAALVAGPRGDVRGPFNALLRSPELADRVQKVGEYIRFGGVLPARLNELAILVTARYWGAQFEWYAHLKLALKAGLDAGIAEDIAHNRRPAAMSADLAAVHDFCHQLHHRKAVDDESYAAVLALFGEQGVVELVATCGYYTLVAMVLNVDRHPLPEGVEEPLK